MKKILIISASLYIGGAEKVARDIALYADPKQYEFHYIVFGNEIGAYESQLTSIGAKIFHISPPSAGYVSYCRTLKTLINENRYEAVHAHTMFNAGWAMLVAKQCGVPVRIAHAHSSLQGVKASLPAKLYEAIMRRLIINCASDYVACGVTAGNRLFGETLFRKSGTLILNGIDTSAFAFHNSRRQKIRQELGWTDTFIIGHVGHLSVEKNQIFLIDLMPKILKIAPNARLLLLGDGADRANLEQEILKLGLDEYVRLTGNVMNVSEYLSAMDVFAFPSLYEGMPLSVLEVQANGLPCVLSTGVPEDVILTDIVQPVPLSDPEKWVKCICAAKRKDSDEYAELMYEAGFDTETAMQNIYNIYERKGKR